MIPTKLSKMHHKRRVMRQLLYNYRVTWQLLPTAIYHDSYMGTVVWHDCYEASPVVRGHKWQLDISLLHTEVEVNRCMER
jgi:hypothetical protein